MATLAEFRALHKRSSSIICKSSFHIDLPSATDPTQDIPIKNIQLAANGVPVNVRQMPSFYTNAGVDKLSSVDRRNNDKFDVVGELQAHEQRAQNIVKSIKQNQNETEKN